MQITNENKGNGNASLKVVVEQKDYEKNVADKLRETRQKAALPGFRPGKVPASLIQKRYRKAILVDEVNDLVSKNLSEYLKDQEISLLGRPLLDHEQAKKIDWDQTADFEFVFDIAVSPSIQVNLGQMSFDYYKIRVDDQMMQESLESVCMRFGTNEEEEIVGDNGSVRGDFLQLDDKGENLPDGIHPKGVLIAIDLITDESVRNDFIGKKKGDTIIFDPVIAFGDRHEISHMLNISHEDAENLDSRFSFTIYQILNFKKAELNAELFTKVYGQEAGITTEEQFKEKISEEIGQNLAQSSTRMFQNDARESLVNRIPFDLPVDFLRRYLQEINQGVKPEEIDKEISDYMKDLRWKLIKDSIIKAYDLNIVEEEIVYLAKQLSISQFHRYGIFEYTEDQVNNLAKKILENEEEKERVVLQLYEIKVFQVIKQEAEIITKEVTSDEFKAMTKNNQAEEE